MSFFNLRPGKTALDYADSPENHLLFHNLALKEIGDYLACTGISLKAFTDMPAVDAIKLMLDHSMLNIDDWMDSKKMYSLQQDSDNKIFLKDEEDKVHYIHFIGHPEKIQVENLDLPLMHKKSTHYNSDIIFVFLRRIEKQVYKFCLDKFFPRHEIYTKIKFFRFLKKIKWIKNDDYFRKIITQIESEFPIINKEYNTRSGGKMLGIGIGIRLIHHSDSHPRMAKCDWAMFRDENDLFIQGGDKGIVFSDKGNYITSFVEVFPKNLKNGNKIFSSFIRGEGKSFEEAEASAFNKLKKAKECVDHDWDRRDRDNGHAFCRKCGVFNSEALNPLTKCKVCSIPCAGHKDNEDNSYCPLHYYRLDLKNVIKESTSDYLKNIYIESFERNKKFFSLFIKEFPLEKFEDAKETFFDFTLSLDNKFVMENMEDLYEKIKSKF